MKVFRIKFIEDDKFHQEDYQDKETYHKRLVEFRCNIKEQTYIPVEKDSDDYSALIDLIEKWKH